MHIEPTSLPRPDVSALVVAITQADARSPLNELGELALAGAREATCWVATHGDSPTPVGFALLDSREGVVLLGVHPDHRRRGIGTALATTACTHPAARTFWAFGDTVAAQALASGVGLTKTRDLLQMTRPLTPIVPSAPPAGFTLDTYRPDDAAQVVAVNAAAFAHHPEQGNLTLADFGTLTAQPWFDPDGLIVARRGERIVGFHWTKRHDATTGEVYVIAVAPEAEGHGLGRSLLEAGLAHLYRQGVRHVSLYVESCAQRVIAMYRAATFEITTTDASYAIEGR